MPVKKASTSIPLVNAVFRTFTILERLAEKRDYSLEELAYAVGLPKPTAYRFLQTMQEIGYIRKNDTDRYSLSLKLFNVGSHALDHLDLHDAARPEARALLDLYGESVHMGVLDGDSAVYVLKLDSTHSVCMHSRVGRRVPLHCTAIGKVLLAFSPEETIKRILSETPLVAFTERTITNVATLNAEIVHTRSMGYGVDLEEFELGVLCVAAPIFDYAGRCIAALSVSRPRFRFDTSRQGEYAAAVITAAARISDTLGYPSDS